MRIQHVSGPVAEPVTTEEALAQVRTQGEDAEEILEGIIPQAREYVEKLIDRPLAVQTFDGYLSTFPDETYIPFPIGGVQSVTSIVYTTEEGELVTMDSLDYRLDPVAGRVYLTSGRSWPTEALAEGFAIRIRFTAGYSSCPGPLKRAVLLLVGHFWENTEAVVAEPGIVASPMPLGLERLIENYRYFPDA